MKESRPNSRKRRRDALIAESDKLTMESFYPKNMTKKAFLKSDNIQVRYSGKTKSFYH